MIFAWFELRKHKITKEPQKYHFDFKVFISLFVISFFLFSYSWLLISDPDGFVKFYGSEDYILYGKVSKFLSTTGHENGFNILNTMDKYYNWLEPYHYFDLWGAAFVNITFGINNFIGLKLIIYPTFFFLYAVGLLAIIDRNNFRSLILAFALLMVGGVMYGFHTNIRFLDNLNNISYNLLNPNFSKLNYLYVFSISAYLLYKNNVYGLSFLCILSLSIANIVALPSLFSALCLILVLGYFNQSLRKEVSPRYVVYLICTALGFAAFYYFTNRSTEVSQGSEIYSPFKLLADNLQMVNLSTQRNIILASILGIIIIYLPFFLTIIFNRYPQSIRKMKISTPFIFLISAISVSILLWCVLYAEINSRQIHQDFSIPLLNVAFSILSIKYLTRLNVRQANLFSIKHISILLMFLLVLENLFITIQFATKKRNQVHSFEYLAQIKDRLISNSIVASLKGDDLMREVGDKLSIIYTLGDYLFLMDKNVYPVNVGDLNTTVDSSSAINYFRSKKAIKDGIFFRYSQLPQNQKMEKDELMLKFLKEYKIKQMIVSKTGIIPDTLMHFVKEVITDPVSKERFVDFNL